MTYVEAWARAFALTFVTEAVVAGALLRSVEPRLVRRLLVVLFAQLVTHPAVWFIYPRLFTSQGTALAVAEAWALLGETVFYAVVFPRLGAQRAFLTSLAANGLSYGLGELGYLLGVLLRAPRTAAPWRRESSAKNASSKTPSTRIE